MMWTGRESDLFGFGGWSEEDVVSRERATTEFVDDDESEEGEWETYLSTTFIFFLYVVLVELEWRRRDGMIARSLMALTTIHHTDL
jgi:hypothetical protein